MSSPVLPIMMAAAAAVFLSGKKRKTYTSDSSSSIDEDSIVLDSEPSGESDGDFYTEEEDLSMSDDEASSEGSQGTTEASFVDLKKLCNQFLEEIYEEKEDSSVAPIKDVAIYETIIPSMKDSAEKIANNIGVPLDPETVGPALVTSALNALVPACQWRYNEQDGEFYFGDSEKIESEAGMSVLYGLIDLSARFIDLVNSNGELSPQEILTP